MLTKDQHKILRVIITNTKIRGSGALKAQFRCSLRPRHIPIGVRNSRRRVIEEHLLSVDWSRWAGNDNTRVIS